MAIKKICIVTGASSGIGKATAMLLSKMQFSVILVARDYDRGWKVLKEIEMVSGNKKNDLMIVDLSNLQSVYSLINQIKATYKQLHLLVNCAGAAFRERQLSVDKFEMTFATNHLGPFLLTTGLLNMLINSAPSRIVNVASEAHRPNQIDFNDLMWDRKKYIGYAGDIFQPTAYGQSKLANIMFTYELARKLAETGVNANCLHPGFVATNFCKNNKDPLNILFSILKPFRISPEKSARSIIKLCTSEDFSGVTGKYFNIERMMPSSPFSYGKEDSKRLWRICEKMSSE